MHTTGHADLVLTQMDAVAFSLAAFTSVVYWLFRGDRDLAHWKQPIIFVFSGILGFFLFRYLRDYQSISLLLSFGCCFLSGLAAQPFAVLFIERGVPALFDKLLNRIDKNL